VALSGQFEPLLLALGAASVAFALYVARRMDVVDRESHPLHMSFALIHYWARLAWEIVVASLQVAREILRPRLAITPTVVSFESRQETDLGKVILGNSITLTPGTVTLDIQGQTFTVHGLTRASAEDVAAGIMDARVPADVEDLS
jgi:multicomponent Na+:H+ antiporter subunit E